MRKTSGREPARTDFFATVAEVTADGITLLFDGTDAATTKKYKFNKSATFAAGDRVKCLRISGTVVVEYPI